MKCRYCGSMENVKWGKRNNKGKDVQLFKCLDCKKRFCDSNHFIYSHDSEEIISKAMYLYFEGLSLRKVSRYIKNFHDLEVSHVTIYYWVLNYTERIKQYLDPYIPVANSVWQIDEMCINVKGEQMWLWNIIDQDTRFFLSTRITKGRKVENAVSIMRNAVEKAQNNPEAVISDGLAVYHKMFKEVFGDAPNTMYHKWGVSEKDIYFNSFVERLNGSIRERVKVSRAYKEIYNAQIIIEGWQIYYNYVRPHSSLDGKTPAEAAGINLNLGKDKWLSLLRLSNC